MILVDPLRWHTDRRTLLRKQWAHLVATGGPAELHTFALELGLRKAWFQGDARHPHYDLRPRQWRLAQVAGAMLVSRRDLVRRAAVPICARFPECERGATMRMSPDMDLRGVAVCSAECFQLLLLPALSPALR